jgi:transcriptional regulator with XRE-family HTH domain
MPKGANTKGGTTQTTMVDEFTSTPEGMAQFQQERVILDVAVLIRALLKEQGLAKADLAARLGRSKAFVTQLLNGRANMTLRTLSDIMCSLNRSLRIASGPLEARAPGERSLVAWRTQPSQNHTLYRDSASLPNPVNVNIRGGASIPLIVPNSGPGIA